MISYDSGKFILQIVTVAELKDFKKTKTVAYLLYVNGFQFSAKNDNHERRTSKATRFYCLFSFLFLFQGFLFQRGFIGVTDIDVLAYTVCSAQSRGTH